ncbi:MAG: hypothetical protein WA156_19285 [Methylocystis silviterrae]
MQKKPLVDRMIVVAGARDRALEVQLLGLSFLARVVTSMLTWPRRRPTGVGSSGWCGGHDSDSQNQIVSN